MKGHASAAEVISRLSKIEGHVKGVKKMAEEGKGCEDILLQISAVQSALKQVSRLILEDHLEHCVFKSIESGDSSEAVESFKTALSRILKEC